MCECVNPKAVTEKDREKVRKKASDTRPDFAKPQSLPLMTIPLAASGTFFSQKSVRSNASTSPVDVFFAGMSEFLVYLGRK